MCLRVKILLVSFYLLLTILYDAFQVSLIAVNVLGSDVETKHHSNHESNSQETKLNEILNNPDYISPYDDLAFVMYVDVDIAKIIRNMEIKKHFAVISRLVLK